MQLHFFIFILKLIGLDCMAEPGAPKLPPKVHIYPPHWGYLSPTMSISSRWVCPDVPDAGHCPSPSPIHNGRQRGPGPEVPLTTRPQSIKYGGKGGQVLKTSLTTKLQSIKYVGEGAGPKNLPNYHTSINKYGAWRGQVVKTSLTTRPQ